MQLYYFRQNYVKQLILNHSSQQVVNVVLAVAEVTTLSEVVGLLSPSSVWIVQLERPQEVGGLLELGADVHNLVDDVLNANDTLFAQRLLDDRVVSESDTLLVHLSETTLVDQLSDALQIWVAPGDVRLGDSEHVNGGLVESDKNGVNSRELMNKV